MCVLEIALDADNDQVITICPHHLPNLIAAPTALHLIAHFEDLSNSARIPWRLIPGGLHSTSCHPEAILKSNVMWNGIPQGLKASESTNSGRLSVLVIAPPLLHQVYTNARSSNSLSRKGCSHAHNH